MTRPAPEKSTGELVQEAREHFSVVILDGRHAWDNADRFHLGVLMGALDRRQQLLDEALFVGVRATMAAEGMKNKLEQLESQLAEARQQLAAANLAGVELGQKVVDAKNELMAAKEQIDKLWARLRGDR